MNSFKQLYESYHRLLAVDCHYFTITSIYINYQTLKLPLTINSNIGSSQSVIIRSCFEVCSVFLRDVCSWCCSTHHNHKASACADLCLQTHRRTRLFHCLASQMTRKPMTNSQFTSTPREPGKQQNTVRSRASYLRTFTVIEGGLLVIVYIFQHHFYLKYLGRSV